MKQADIKTVYDLMRYCRMPLWFQRSIRDMKVGDTFILGKYTEPVSIYNGDFHAPQRASDDGEAHLVAEAWIEKERGLYTFYGTWTFPTKPERALIMTSGNFKVRKGGIVDFEDKDDSVKNFALVCRYLSYILSRMSHKDKEIYFKNKSFPLLNGVWLDSDSIERRQRAIEVDGKIKRVWISYKNYLPTHQLSAIVDAAFATGVLQLEN